MPKTHVFASTDEQGKALLMGHKPECREIEDGFWQCTPDCKVLAEVVQGLKEDRRGKR